MPNNLRHEPDVSVLGIILYSLTKIDVCIHSQLIEKTN
jgi:hypothetical protein